MTHPYFAGDNRSTRERRLAGDLYLGSDPQSAQEYLRAIELTRELAQLEATDQHGYRRIVEELLGSVGENVNIRPPLSVDYGKNIHIGAGTFINFNLTALDVVEIRIGRNCQIGPNVQLLTPTHPLDPDLRRDGLEAGAPITIGDNVWLGGGVIVCPGVTIGDNSVIGAGGVVTKDIPANSVAVGNPARVIKTLG